MMNDVDFSWSCVTEYSFILIKIYCVSLIDPFEFATRQFLVFFLLSVRVFATLPEVIKYFFVAD